MGEFALHGHGVGRFKNVQGKLCCRQHATGNFIGHHNRGRNGQADVFARQVEVTRQTEVNVQSDGTATISLGSGTVPNPETATSGVNPELVKGIMVETFRSPAISALLIGLALGILAQPDSVYKSFYEPLFRGLLSILMFVMGAEAWPRLSELRKVAHETVYSSVLAPRRVSVRFATY